MNDINLNLIKKNFPDVINENNEISLYKVGEYINLFSKDTDFDPLYYDTTVCRLYTYKRTLILEKKNNSTSSKDLLISLINNTHRT